MKGSTRVQNLIDFASERGRRQELARRASEGAEQFASELRRAGSSLADLAWTLAAPVRDRDPDLTLGIYSLALTRLSSIVNGALADIDQPSEIERQLTEQAENVAFSAFQSRLLVLMAAALDRQPM